MPRKGGNTNLGIALFLAAVIIAGIVTGGFQKNPFTGGPLSTVVGNPAPPLSGAGAYCPGTSSVYTVPFGASLPANCQNVLETLLITPQAWNPGTNSPMGIFKAANTVTCKVFQLQAGGWVNTETIQGSSGGTCTSANSYLPGSQIQIEFCENSGTCDLSTSTYSTTKTVMYCPLPSVAGSGMCGVGPGSGFVPLWTPSGSTTIQYSYYMPILAWPGDQYQGVNAANKQQLRETFQNGTSTTSTGAVCYMKTNVGGNCAAPTSSQGKWSLTLSFQNFGTFPAAPYAFGTSQFTQVDAGLQTGSAARGPLNYVLQVEIKATTNNDMCIVQNGGTVNFITSTGPISITPTIIAKGGSATDTLYLYTIPDAAVTRAADQSGNVLLNGVVTGTFFFDCTQVYNGSGDVVAIAPTQYQAYSTRYVTAYAGNSINPEAIQVGGGADATNTVANGIQIKT